MPDPLLIAAGITGLTGLVDSWLSGKKQKELSDQNNAMQREFAQNSISWRVADAKRAGIHPLAALGVTPFNYQPQYLGGTDSGIREMGQNIAGYISKMKTGFEKRLLAATVRKAEAEATMAEKEARGGTGTGVDSSGTIIDNNMTQGGLDVTRIGKFVFDPKSNSYKRRGDTSSRDMGFDTFRPKIPLKSTEGIKAGFPAMNMFSPDREGWFRFMLTEEVSEALESDWFAQGANFFLEGMRNFNAAWYEMEPDRKDAIRWRNMMRRLRDEGLPDPGPGAEWAWRGFPYNGFKKRVKHGVRGHFYWNWRGRNCAHIVN